MAELITSDPRSVLSERVLRAYMEDVVSRYWQHVPALERRGFVLVIREPWWYEHRCLRREDPACILHVFSPDCAETERHRIFRDWLRSHPEDCSLYAAAKIAAAADTRATGGHTMDYNARKELVVREIYSRAFHYLGLTP